MVLRRNPLHSNQYEYREGVSAETALHAFVSRIEAQLERGNYAVTVFLYVAGAFSDTSLHIICEEAAGREAPMPIVDWMMDLLGTRWITSTLESYRCSGTVSKGTPQGRVTSPLESGGRRATQVDQRWKVLRSSLRRRLCCGLR